MQLYTKRHRHYCGIDLHARTMHLCITDEHGSELASKNIPTDPTAFLRTIEPYREDLAVGVECIFCWYWLHGPNKFRSLAGWKAPGADEQVISIPDCLFRAISHPPSQLTE
ncbi:MAG: hypothetical protein AB8H80_04855 [Planctomycetota bacterium]